MVTWLRGDAHTPTSIPTTFDLLTLTARDLAQLLSNRTFTSLQLTKEYLRRIDIDDRSGLHLRTVLELTPAETALRIAKERDLEREKGLLAWPSAWSPTPRQGALQLGS